MAMLRLACRVLGVDRKNLALGSFGFGGVSVAGVSLLVALMASGQAHAQTYSEGNCGTYNDPDNNGLPAATVGPKDGPIDEISVVIGCSASSQGQNFGTAIGFRATVTGTGGTALGTNATANAAGSAIGRNTVAGIEAVAIGGSNAAGKGAVAASSHSVAIGAESKAGSGGDVSAAVAIGYKSTAGNGALALGELATAADLSIAAGGGAQSAAAAVALGLQAHALGGGSAALGPSSTASGIFSIAVGVASEASGEHAIGLGVDATASAKDSAAIGENSLAEGEDSIAFGGTADAVNLLGAHAAGNAATAIGRDAEALRDNAIALGTGAIATDPAGVTNGSGMIAIGNQSSAIGDSALAVGNLSNATGKSSIAIGRDSGATATLATDTGMIAVGLDANATGEHALSIGSGSGATGLYAVAYGGDAHAGLEGTALGGFATAGVNATAVGAEATAADLAVALGTLTNASGKSSAALGVGATSGGENSLALGAQAQSIASDSIGIGQASRAEGDHSIALGGTADPTDPTKPKVGAYALGTSAIAIGRDAEAQRNNSIALGTNAIATATLATDAGMIAIGLDANATGEHALSIGSGSGATGLYSVAYGGDAHAGLEGTALGGFATAGVNATAVGAEATAADLAVALGTLTNASGKSSAALGVGATSGGENSLALGAQAQSIASDSIGIGQASRAEGDHSIALGGTADPTDPTKPKVGAHAIGFSAIAIGRDAEAQLDEAIAIGAGTVSGAAATVVGASAEGNGDFSAAFGNFAKADGVVSTALGSSSWAQATSSIAIGNGATTEVASDSAIAIGAQAYAPGSNSIAIGDTSVAGLFDPATGLLVQGTATTALGSGATATHDGAVALGAGSITSDVVQTGTITISGQDIAVAGVSPGSTVSIGDVGAERTLTNLAAGRVAASSTDAINGSQLFAVVSSLEELSELAVEYDGIDKQNITLAGTGAGTTITNLAAGTLSSTSSDAVNGSQLFATNENVTALQTDALKWNATLNGGLGAYDASHGTANPQKISNVAAGVAATDAVNVSQLTAAVAAADIKYFNATSGLGDSTATGSNSIAIGPVAQASATDSIAIGNNAVASQAGAVALGANTTTGATVSTAGATIKGQAFTFAGGSAGGTVSVGSDTLKRTITNVAAGQLNGTSTDAVNGSQLFAAVQAINAIDTAIGDVDDLSDRAVRYDGPVGSAKGTITLAGDGAGGGTKIVGLKAGDLNAASTDAVNGSQLFATNQNVAANTASIGTHTTQIGALQTDALQWSAALGAYDARHGTANPQKISNVAAGVAATDAVNFGQLTATNQNVTNLTTTVNSLDALAVKYDDAGKATVTLGGGAGGTKITNVAAGVAASDAVNFGQLTTTNQNVAANTASIATHTTQIGALQTDALQWSAALGAYDARHGTANPQKISNVAAGVAATDAVNVSQLTAAVAAADIKYFNATSGLGDSTATGSNSIAIGPVAQASAGDSIAIGNNAVASQAGAVALGANTTTGATVSTAGATIKGQAFTFAGGSAGGTVSVGSDTLKRTITNVAAGQLNGTSTDAVNGSQLFAAVQAINAIDTAIGDVDDLSDRAVRYDGPVGSAKGTITLAGDGAGGGTKIVGLKAGDLNAASTDAVNGSQLFATNQNVAANTASIGTHTTQIGALQTDALQWSAALGAYDARHGTANPQKISNVAAGVAATDAVNFGQLTATNQNITNLTTTVNSLDALAVKYDDAGKATVTLGGGAGGTKITNVAAGVAASDAVNFGQLTTTNQNVAANTASIATHTTQIGALQTDALQWSAALGAYDARHGTANPQKISNVAAGVAATDAVNFGQLTATNQNVTNLTTTVNSLDALAVKYDDAGKATVTLGGGAGGTKITNVAAGVAASDAVNFGQLTTTNQNVAANTASIATHTTQIGALQTDALQWSAALGAYDARHGTANPQKISNVAAGVAATDAVNVSQLTAAVAAADIKYFNATSGLGDSTATGSNSIAIGPVAQASAGDSIAIGNNAVASQAGAVALGANTTTGATVSTAGATIKGQAFTFAGGSAGGTVSVGSDTLKRTITNVAAGQLNGTSTDAVNGSQLFAAVQAINAIDTAIGDVDDLSDRAVRYDGPVGSAKGTITLAGDGAGGGTKIVGLKAGDLNAASTDAVNGSQLFATNQNVTNLTTTVNSLDALAVKYDDAGKTTVTLGGGAGGTKITNVAAGVAASDAVNFGQLTATNQAVAANTASIATHTAQIGGLQNDALQWSAALGAYDARHGTANPQKISNVAAGVAATDAVNVSQLTAVQQNITNVVNNGVKYFHASSTKGDSVATGIDSIAVGPVAVANATDAVAIGRGANATSNGSVAIGADSAATAAVATTSATIADTLVNFAGTAPVGTVSFGKTGSERTLTNVAAGRLIATSTDAVNGSQLFAVVQAVNAIDNELGDVATLNDRAVLYDGPAGAAKGKITLAGDGIGGGTLITSVGKGEISEDSTDAVNGSQLWELSQAIGAGGTSKYFHANSDDADSLANGEDAIAVGPSTLVDADEGIGMGNGALVDLAAKRGVALGAGSRASAEDALAFGANAHASFANSVALGANATTAVGARGSYTGYGVAGALSSVGEVSMGSAGAERQVTNVAAGSASTDAVNVGQLNQVAQNTAAAFGGGATYDPATGAYTKPSYAVSGGTYDNVGDALDAHDVAISNLDGRVTTIEGDVANLDGRVTTIEGDLANLTNIVESSVGLVSQEGGTPGDGDINIGGETGGTRIDVAGTGGDRVITGLADGVADNDAVTVRQLQASTANSVQYDTADHGSVTFNQGGTSVVLHNVANGNVAAGSTDAVNGGQLYQTNQQVTQLVNGEAGPFRANNTSNLAGPAATGADAVAGGFGAVASAERSLAVGTNASATGKNSVALGYGSTDGGIANVVSVGAVGGERRVTNVAAGIGPSDAVNVGQLQAGMTSILNQSKAYTDARFEAINFDISKINKRADEGTASALAAAGLPQASTPGMGMFAVSMGVWRDETAFAFGASKAFNDGHTIVKGGATYTSGSRTFGANVGVGYQF